APADIYPASNRRGGAAGAMREKITATSGLARSGADIRAQTLAPCDVVGVVRHASRSSAIAGSPRSNLSSAPASSIRLVPLQIPVWSLPDFPVDAYTRYFFPV